MHSLNVIKFQCATVSLVSPVANNEIYPGQWSKARILALTSMTRRGIIRSLHVASNVFVRLLGCGAICAGDGTRSFRRT